MEKTAAFDKAFKLFYNGDYKKAGAEFDKLIASEKTPAWAKQRIDQFNAMVKKRLETDSGEAPGSLGTISYHLNNGDWDQAKAFIESSDLSESHKFFLTGEMLAEQGQLEEAAEAIKKAIEADKINLGYALNSVAIGACISEEPFQFLKEAQENAQN